MGAMFQGRDQSRLYIDVQHGLCNRLRALVSAAAIAHRTGRQLFVIWVPDHHCEARLSDLLHYSGPVIEDAYTAELLRARSDQVYNYMEVEEGAQFQQSIEPLPGQDIYIRSAYTLTSPHSDIVLEQSVLRNLRPADAVLNLIGTVEHPSDVAVHVRMSTGEGYDHLSYEAPENWPANRHAELTEWRRKSHVDRFIARLDGLVAQGRADRIFVAADLPDTYAQLESRYAGRVRRLERDLFDRSAQQLVFAMADLLLLTSAPILLASTWSSFSDLAVRMGSAKREILRSGIDF